MVNAFTIAAPLILALVPLPQEGGQAVGDEGVPLPPEQALPTVSDRNGGLVNAKEAFEYRGFERTVQTTNDEELKGVGPPSWTEEDLALLAQGSLPRAPGTIFHGLMWWHGDQFATQWIGAFQDKSLNQDWDILRGPRYLFPSKRANFCGEMATFGWKGAGFNAIRVVPKAHKEYAAVAPAVERMRQVWMLSANPQAYFQRLIEHRGGRATTSVEGRHTEIVWQSPDGQIEARYFRDSPEDRDGFHWAFWLKNLQAASTSVMKMEVSPVARESLTLPHRPGALPQTFVGIDNPDVLVFLNFTDDEEWPTGVVISPEREEPDAGNFLRIGFGIATVVMIGSFIAFREMRRRFVPYHTKELRS